MIKNIIFDFGDIFINLDKKATQKELGKLGIVINKELENTHKEYEKGLVSTDEFINIHQEKFENLTTAKLLNAWNLILKDLPDHRFNFIKNLAESNKYKLFLLSNTNDIHIKWVKKNWGKKKFNVFKKCFEQFYLSYKINLRKPETEIYEYVLRKNNLIPEETLFIDDVSENTEAAKQLGIHVWNLIPGKEDVVNLFTSKQALF